MSRTGKRVDELIRPASAVAELLDHALTGKSPGRIRVETGAKHVEPILRAHGYPDPAAMADMRDQLRFLKDEPVWFEIAPSAE